MNPEFSRLVNAAGRREFLTAGMTGLAGSLALKSLLADDVAPAGSAQPVAGVNPLAEKQPHFAPQAKRLIYLHMVGAPSQLELFEHKPVLRQYDGQPCPAELLEGQRFAFLRGTPSLMGSRFQFARHGESGAVFSELLPHLAQRADDLAIVRSLKTEEFNHGPAQVFMLTGFGRQGRPGLGAWVTYGLGSASQNLPAFVVLVSGKQPGGGSSLWGSGFLPSVYQGVQFRTKGEPVLYVTSPKGIDRAARRRTLDDLRALNQLQLEQTGDADIATRIASYELAFRMQTAVPELMELKGEPQHIHELYGIEDGKPGFAANCLLARRLIERGVRCVQLYDQGWDHHGNIAANLPKKCREIDRPVAGLLTDLKQRGLLQDTLVVWGSEFGRTPMLQGTAGPKAGRDHHKDAFTVWLAGGGVRPGVTYGETDDLGYHITRDPMTVHDLHATVLHLMGLDHTRLTWRYQGRDFRLTDVSGQVPQALLADATPAR